MFDALSEPCDGQHFMDVLPSLTQVILFRMVQNRSTVRFFRLCDDTFPELELLGRTRYAQLTFKCRKGTCLILAEM